MSTRNKGESDPLKKTGSDPRLIRDVVSWLIRGATAIIVEWISKGGRL